MNERTPAALSAKEIEALPIEELKANFFDLMNTIVVAHGDTEEENDDAL